MPALDHLVLYVGDLSRSQTFYADLGFRCTPEQHGTGPAHWSISLGLVVLELYPAKPTSSDMPSPHKRIRLGVIATSDEGLTPGTHRDPDGNVVVITHAVPSGS